MDVPTSFHTDDSGWHGCFVLPEDAQTGELKYTVVVEAGGETYEQAGAIEVVERGNL